MTSAPFLVEGKHLSKAFPLEGGMFRRRVGAVQVLKDVSFHLQSGETLAVVGGSGCGKSTLARLLVGLLEPDAGEMLWEGKPLASFSRQERARRIQMVFQDPYASLNPKLSIEKQLTEVLTLTRPTGTLSPGERAYIDGGGRPSPLRETGRTSIPIARPVPVRYGKVAEGRMRVACISLLESVGLSADALSHYPHQFSGGQRQRIAVARALALAPRVLIADEPLSSLDVTTQAQVLDLFSRLKKESGLTFLFITHDLAVARRFADRVMVLKDGEVVEDGTAAAVLKAPQHAYTRALLEAVPTLP